MHPETRAVHSRAPDLADAAPLAVPIYQTSGFSFTDPDVFADGLNRPDGAFVYSRMTNPTVRALEQAVADLEGGAAGLATASGMGAVNLVLQATVRSGEHVIAQRRLYGGASAALRELAGRFDVAVDYVEGDDPAEVRKLLRPETRLLYLETIANPTAHVSDLPALAVVAREAGLRTVVDNTFATPLLCQPIRYGADVVLHSATKYLGGHADVTGGVLVFADAAVHRQVWEYAVELGVAADPFAAWLILRGLHTLPLRMRQHCANAEALARRLAGHPAVTAVHWPGLPSHPSHEVAARLLSGYGGTFSFDLAGGREAGRRFGAAVRLAKLAPSLGGTETLVLHPASTSHRKLNAEQLRAAGITESTIRISVGLEHVDDLWADLAQALTAATLPAEQTTPTAP